MTGHTAHLSLDRRVGPRRQRRGNRGMASGGEIGAMVKAQFGRDANILTQTQLHPALDTDRLARCLGGDFNRKHKFIVIPDGAHSRSQEHLGRGPCDAQVGNVARSLPVKLRRNSRIARRAPVGFPPLCKPQTQSAHIATILRRAAIQHLNRDKLIQIFTRRGDARSHKQSGTGKQSRREAGAKY